MNGTDDILALLNSTHVVVPTETVENHIVTSAHDNTWHSSNSKDEVVQTIPIVILDDGQIAFHCNGQYFIVGGIQGEEVVTEHVLSNAPIDLNTSETLSASIPSVTVPDNNVALSVPVSAEQSLGNAVLNDEIDVVSVDCEVNSNNANNIKQICSINGGEEWIPFGRLKDFYSSANSFRCLTCQFTTQNEEAISSHAHSEFVILSQLRSITVKSTDSNNDESKNSKECQQKFLYLCSQCSSMFESLDICRDHMIKDHNMIFSVKEKLQPLPLKQIDTNSVNSEKSNNANSNSSSDATTDSVPETTAKASAENVKQKVKNSGKSKIKSLKVDPDYDVRPFKCKHVSCVLRFPSSEALALHTACHKGPNRREYACSQCGSKFDEWRHCSLHLWYTHNIDVDLYTCGVCGLHKTTSRLNLETHMKIHRDVKEFPCPECGKRFKQKAQLRNHRITHMNKNETNSANQPPRWYMTQKCHICFKMYADSKCLKKHIQAVHSKLKPYVCHVCGHSSARKAMLQAHLRQHTGEKPYACQTCSFRTGDHNSLRRHVMRHSGKRPYKCPHCSYASIQSTCFKNHLQIRHPGKGGAFACARCTFTTVSHSSFLQHLSDHKNNLIPSEQNAFRIGDLSSVVHLPSTVHHHHHTQRSNRQRSTFNSARKMYHFRPILNASDYKQSTDDVEVFPENVAAAQLVYQCLGACPPGDGSRFQADVTARSTSDDGTKQTITIEIPTNSEMPTTDDEDTTHCFLQSEEVDTGGITIPADPTEPILVDFT